MDQKLKKNHNDHFYFIHKNRRKIWVYNDSYTTNYTKTHWYDNDQFAYESAGISFFYQCFLDYENSVVGKIFQVGNLSNRTMVVVNKLSQKLNLLDIQIYLYLSIGIAFF